VIQLRKPSEAGPRVAWRIVLRVFAPIPCRSSRLDDRLPPHGAAHAAASIHERLESTDCWFAPLGKPHTQNGLARKILKTINFLRGRYARRGGSGQVSRSRSALGSRKRPKGRSQLSTRAPPERHSLDQMELNAQQFVVFCHPSFCNGDRACAPILHYRPRRHIEPTIN
jgi:hypothetical protein